MTDNKKDQAPEPRRDEMEKLRQCGKQHARTVQSLLASVRALPSSAALSAISAGS